MSESVERRRPPGRIRSLRLFVAGPRVLALRLLDVCLQVGRRRLLRAGPSGLAVERPAFASGCGGGQGMAGMAEGEGSA
jgi:hypothetical protein